MSLPGYLRQPCNLLLRVHRLSLRNDVVIRNAVRQQVVASHAALGLPRIQVAPPAQRNHQRSDPLPIKLDRMVQPRMQHRRRPARILRRPEHRDRIRRPRLVIRSHRVDLEIQPAKPPHHRQHRHPHHNPQPPPLRRSPPVCLRCRTGGSGTHSRRNFIGTGLQCSSSPNPALNVRAELQTIRQPPVCLLPPPETSPISCVSFRVCHSRPRLSFSPHVGHSHPTFVFPQGIPFCPPSRPIIAHSPAPRARHRGMLSVRTCAAP